MFFFAASGAVYYLTDSDRNMDDTIKSIHRPEFSFPIPQIIDIAVGQLFMALDNNDYYIDEYGFIPNIPLIISLPEPIVKMDNNNNSRFVLGRSGKLYSWATIFLDN